MPLWHMYDDDDWKRRCSGAIMLGSYQAVLCHGGPPAVSTCLHVVCSCKLNRMRAGRRGSPGHVMQVDELNQVFTYMPPSTICWAAAAHYFATELHHDLGIREVHVALPPSPPLPDERHVVEH